MLSAARPSRGERGITQNGGASAVGSSCKDSLFAKDAKSEDE